jgi:NADH:ubiquinone oxidoreductase subunit 3 (subunit A)
MFLFPIRNWWEINKSILLFLLSITLWLLIIAILSQPNFECSERRFECGLRQREKGKPSFSYQFFIIAVLFLIFDVEITVIAPICLENWEFINVFTLSMIILVLLISTLYEWLDRKLEWSKWMKLILCKSLWFNLNNNEISNLLQLCLYSVNLHLAKESFTKYFQYLL